MDIRIKTTDYEITPDTSRYLDKCLRAVEKLVAGIDGARCEVELGQSAKHSKKTDKSWFAEVNLKAQKDTWRAAAKAASVKAAIDMVKDQIVMQVKKAKDLKKTAVKKGGQKVKEMAKSGRSKVMKKR
ncbi:hypothetical protein FJY93_01760 [Candidatus Kaiserbacteria bacterium]|nr:hypothetical protein [Candidatus Kaiserbacteria bacterium]